MLEMISLEKNKGRVILILIALAHIAGVFFYFGARNLFNVNPIYNHDYPYHLYNCYQAVHYYSLGQAWGYNPFFNAGYPSGITLDNDLFQLWCYLFSRFVTPVIMMKIWVCVILLLLPFLAYYSSRNFKCTGIAPLISTIFCAFYLYGDPFANSMVYFGMYNFMLLCFLTLFLVSLLYRYTYDHGRAINLLLAVFIPLTLFIHSASVISVTLVCAVFYATNFRKIDQSRHLYLAMLLSVSVALFLWRVGIPFMLQFKKYLIYNSSYLFQIGTFKTLVNDFIQGPRCIKTSILLLGMCGLVQWSKSQKGLCSLFAPQVLLLAVLIYGHNVMFPALLKPLQPYKFIVLLVVIMTIPAGVFIGSVIKKGARGVAAALILVCFHSFLFFRFAPNTPHGLFTTPPKDYLALKKWISENTDASARIMLQTGLPARYSFARPTFAYGLLSMETNRQLLGGPFRYSSFAQSFPSLYNESLFGMSLENLDAGLLRKYLELYNVGWIIARSHKVKKALSEISQPGLLFPVAKIKRFQIFKVDAPHNFVFNGQAKVTADYNLIKVEGLKKGREQEIILKYHWHPTLRATGGITIEPVRMLSAPVPFIKVVDAKADNFEIHNVYR